MSEKRNFNNIYDAMIYLSKTEKEETKYADDCFVNGENLCDIFEKLSKKENK